MEFGYHTRKGSRVMGPTKMLQVTFAVGMCLPTGEELSVYRPHTDQGLCVVWTVAGEKPFCY